MDRGIKKNIGISMLMKPISIVLTFIYTPLVLTFLGDAKYGVWAIILNILSWISYFDIGIGNGLRNKLAESFAKGDEESCQIYISTGYLAAAIVSFIFCFLLIFVWNFFHLSTFFNLDAGGAESLFAINLSIIFVSVNFILGLVKIVLYSIHKNGLLSVMGAIVQLLQIVVLLILREFLSESIIAVAIMYGMVTLVSNLIAGLLIKKRYPFLFPSLSKIKLEYLKPLMVLGLGFFVMQIATLVLNTTDNLLIANLFGSAEVTPYTMVYKCFYLFIQIHAIVIMPMWSAYTAANATKDYAWMKSTIRKMNLFSLLITVGIIIGIFLFEPFAAIWLGRRLDYGTSLIVIVAIYMIAQMFANNYSAFLSGVGYIKISVILSVIAAVINIPFSIFLARDLNWGLSGIIGGSLLAMLPGTIILPFVTRRWFKDRE